MNHQNPQRKKCSCEVCGASTHFEIEAIIQTCSECWEIFNTEMSNMEFEQIYKDIEISVKGFAYNDE